MGSVLFLAKGWHLFNLEDVKRGSESEKSAAAVRFTETAAPIHQPLR